MNLVAEHVGVVLFFTLITHTSSVECVVVAIENASAGKAATQSETIPGRVAGYGVDGNTRTTDLSACASAFADSSFGRAWWQVNLGDFYLVKKITVYFPTVSPG